MSTSKHKESSYKDIKLFVIGMSVGVIVRKIIEFITFLT